MQKVLSLETNIFLMMAIGFILRKTKVLEKSAERAITDLVMFVVLPCNIFTSFLGESVSGHAGDLAVIVFRKHRNDEGRVLDLIDRGEPVEELRGVLPRVRCQLQHPL